MKSLFDTILPFLSADEEKAFRALIERTRAEHVNGMIARLFVQGMNYEIGILDQIDRAKAAIAKEDRS